jgi:hypothetical protein
MANAPLAGQDVASLSGDLPDGLSGKFLRKGMDSKLGDLPVGQFFGALGFVSTRHSGMRLRSAIADLRRRPGIHFAVAP